MKNKAIVTFILIFFSISSIAQNVGIGTNTPVYKLDVKGRMRLKTEILGNINTTPGAWLDDYRDGTDRGFIGMQDSIRIGLYGGGAGGIGWGFNFNARTGNVNIGPSTNDGYKLHLTGSDFGLGLYDGTNTFYGDFTNSSGNLVLGSNYGNSLGGGIPPKHMLLNPPGVFSWFLPGNIGINTANPSHAKLEINGSIGAAVAMFGADKFGVTIEANNPEIGFNYFYSGASKTIKAGYGGVVGMSPGNGDIYIGNFNGNQSSSDFGVISGYQNTILIKQNGNVGIGTDNPTYKLAVNGNIHTKEVVVESGWADYVFNEQYHLLPLFEIEKFIQQNKHLPGIPSAKEIQTNGLFIGDIQSKMMQKIEELTLYIIDLEKKYTDLKKEIDSQAKL